jgi:hypothetical protein
MQILHFLSHLAFIEVSCVASVVLCAEQRLLFQLLYSFQDVLQEGGGITVIVWPSPLEV